MFTDWELTETVRKLVLSSLCVFVYAGTAKQLVFCLMCCFLFLAVHFKFQPYDDDGDDNLQTMSLVSSCLTMLYGCVLVAEEESTFLLVLVMLSTLSTLAYFVHIFFSGPAPILINGAKVAVSTIIGRFELLAKQCAPFPVDNTRRCLLAQCYTFAVHIYLASLRAPAAKGPIR